MDLPSFNEHDGHVKLSPLTGPVHPGPSIARWLDRTAEGRQRSALRVLDVGCGRGATVAWLIENGFDAFGVDVRADYIANGLAYLEGDRLRAVDGAAYPFPDEYFDIVLSNQVFEHVANLGALAREVARTTRRSGVGLHVFPAKWIFEEPHMHTPMVHWLPKGPLRRRAIEASLRMGWSAPYFADRPLDERVRIFADYSERETFYRRPAEIRRILESAGLDVDMEDAATDRVLFKLGEPRVPAPLTKTLAWAYRTTRVMYLTTTKMAG